MISSTKPSRPRKTLSSRADSAAKASLCAHCSRYSGEFVMEGNSGRSIEVDACNFQNALEIVLIEKTNFNHPFSLAITQLHFCSEPLPQPIFQINHVSIAERRGQRGTLGR